MRHALAILAIPALILTLGACGSSSAEESTARTDADNSGSSSEPRSETTTDAPADDSPRSDQPKVDRPTRECPDISGFSGYPENAIAIRATGIACETAADLIRRAHKPCKLPPCRVAGFKCTEAGGGHSQLVPIECHRGDRRVAWTWSIGY